MAQAIVAAFALGGAWTLPATSAGAQAGAQTYCGRHFEDVNLDGIQTGDEPALPGVRVNVIDASGVVRFAITGPSGEFCVTGIPGGIHSVRFDDQLSIVSTISVSPAGVQTVVSGQGATAPISIPIVPIVKPGPTTTTSINPDLPLGRSAGSVVPATLQGRRPVPSTTIRATTTTTTTTIQPTTTIRPTTTTPVLPPKATIAPGSVAAPPSDGLALTSDANTDAGTTTTPTTMRARVAVSTTIPIVVAPASGHEPLPETGAPTGMLSSAGLLLGGLGLAALTSERRRYRPRHVR